MYGDTISIDSRVKTVADIDPNPREHWVTDYKALMVGEEDNVSVGYCITPHKKGIEPTVNVKVIPKDYSTYDELDKKLLGIMMAGFPMDYHNHSPEDAYFATYIAMKNLQFQHTDKWNNILGYKFTNDDWASHWKGDQTIINLAKKIYEKGIANPYNKQEKISLGINYLPENKEMEEKSTNFMIKVTPTGNFTLGKLMFNDSYIKDALNAGKATLKVNGSSANFKLGILGTTDTTEGIELKKGDTLEITIDKDFATAGMSSGETKEKPFKFIARDLGNLQAFITTNVDSSRQDYAVLFAEPVDIDGSIKWITEDVPPPPTTTTPPTTTPPEIKKGGLKVVKLNKLTKKETKDAIFRIKGVSSSVSDFFVEIKATGNSEIPLPNGGTATVRDGVIELKNIDVGVYEVTEISPPPYFDYCDFGQNSKSVEVTGDVSLFPKVVFENNPFASLKIRKVDKITGEPVVGAILKIRNVIANFEVELMTNSIGVIELSELPQGNYEISEVYAPLGYVLSSEKKTATLRWGELTDITFENIPKTQLKIVKIDAETGEKLANVRFLLKNPETGATYEAVTDDFGEAIILDLPSGTYNLVETYVSPDYILDKTERTIVIDNSKVNEIVIKNQKKSKIQIKKVDKDGNPIAGVIFNIYKFGENTPIANSPVTTDKDGIAVITNIPAGDYEVQEVSVPNGWKLDTTRYPMVVKDNTGEPFILTVVNKKLPNILIEKLDSITCLPIKCDCTEFEIEKLEEPNKGVIGRFTTNKEGKIELKNLEAGKYLITETKPPTNYAMPKETKHIIELKYDEDFTLQVFNTKLPTLTVIKRDKDTKELLTGAVFEIEKIGKDNGGLIANNPFTTNDKGEIVVSFIAEGSYKITEKIPPIGYNNANPNYQIVDLVAGKDNTITFENTKRPSFKIQKVDFDTGEALKGAMFEVEKLENPNAGILTNSPFTTDEKGLIDIPNMGSGKYKIKEIKPPNGYQLPTQNVNIIEIKDNEDFTFKIENKKLPTLKIIKRDKDTQKVLQGAVFEIEKIGTHNAGLILNNPYTTDVNGVIEIPFMEVGSFKITEIIPPAGYNLSDPNYKIINLIAGKNNTVTFENTRRPSIIIHKVDARTGENLKGSMFEIEKLENPNKGLLTGNPFTTDERGIIDIPNMGSGSYKITEIKPSNGYYLPEDKNAKIITIKENEDYTLKIENTKLPTIIIDKVDGLSGKGIPNTTFEGYYFVNNAPYGYVEAIGTFKTDKNGQIVIPNSKVGWYRFVEVRPTSGYSKPTKNEIVKFFAAGDNAYIRSNPIPVPLKADPSKDIEVKSGNDYIQKVKVESFGLIDLDIVYSSDLEKNTQANNSEEKNQNDSIETVNYEVMDNSVSPYSEIINYPLNSIVIKKTDSITGDLLAGAVFELIQVTGEISGTGGTTIGRYTTDNSGIVIITGLDAGTGYIVKEVKAPHNYSLSENSSQQAWLKPDGTSIVELTFANQPYGSLIISKKDSVTKKALQGAVFEVTDSHGNYVGDTANGLHTTDATGTIKIDHLNAGAYVITEVKSPDNYVLEANPQTVHINYGDSKLVEFYNTPLGGLVIKKYDSVTKEPLKDAIFKVQDIRGAVVGTSDGLYRTDETGTIFIAGLEKGGYKVQEIQSPTGYLLDNSTQTIEIYDNRIYSLEFFNSPLDGLTILKYDSRTKLPLKGAKFRIVKAGNGEIIGDYSTDGDGKITINGLKPAIYEITETKAPDNYIIDTISKVVELKQGVPLQVEFYNTPKDGLVIQKLDGVSKEPLADAIIKVTHANGKLVGEYHTDATGTIIVKNLVSDTYLIQEIKQPTGYVLDNSVKIVHLEQGKPQLIEIFNYKMAGIQILKRDAQTTKPLQGAKFEIRKINGELIGSEFITNANGIVEIPNLSVGWYSVKEVKSPTGYSLNTESQNVEVKTDKLTQVIFNNNKIGSLKIFKKDAITKKGIDGVQFRIVNVNGKLLGEQEGIFTTDKFGIIHIDGKIDEGTYTIEEVKQAKGYALDKQIKKVTIKYGIEEYIEWDNYPLASLLITKLDEKTKKPIPNVEFDILNSKKQSIGKYTTDTKGQIFLDAKLGEDTYYIAETRQLQGYLPNDGLQSVDLKWGKLTETTIYNTPIEGQISVTKKSADNNPITGTLKDSPIKGAEFTIFNENNIKLDTLVTDGKGYAISKFLPYGKYSVVETKAPAYYKPEPDATYVEIKNHKQVVGLEKTNKSAIISTNVEKSGYKEALTGDTIKYEFYNIQNRSIVPLNDFYLHEAIPTDAIRVTRLFTGQYNQNLNYKVMYKTNKNGQFKVLKDNLFTDKMYEIDLTQGLQSDEYVTDIKFEFGTVDIGFREVEKEFIYAKVNSNLPDGYQFTNTVTVGGKYEMQTTSAKDMFTTIVRNPKPEDKGTLPRTGH